jgi:hypothetical protein
METARNGWKRRANAWKRLKHPPKTYLLQGSGRGGRPEPGFIPKRVQRVPEDTPLTPQPQTLNPEAAVSTRMTELGNDGASRLASEGMYLP